jgi:pre-mRNA-splicing factor CDC5/CEF1
VTNEVEAAIQKELVALVSNDARKYPMTGQKVHGTAPPLQSLSDDILDQARLEILSEMPADTAAKAKLSVEEVWSNLESPAELLGLTGYEEGEIEEHQILAITFDVS